MKRINVFTIFWILTGLTLLIASLIYKKQSDAIVAEVEPQKLAISFQKAVKIKSILTGKYLKSKVLPKPFPAFSKASVKSPFISL